MPSTGIETLSEFDNHKLVTFVHDQKTGLRGFIAIHRGGLNNPALGATRLWSYGGETDALRDALRLSRLMSYKSALAGLKYGGGKAVLMMPASGIKDRADFFNVYAQRINYLDGHFVTGTDVGVNDEDVKLMRQETKHVIGSQVDPAYYTAVGVVFGIHSALKQIFGSEKIAGHSFAIQGVGKVGMDILAMLYKETDKIFITDIDEAKLKLARKRFPKVKVVAPNLIHRQEVDVFVPCAMSNALNTDSVAQLRCKIIAGSANNQLESENIGVLLHQLGILYAPDYAINAGGLISVVDEFEHETPSQKRILARIGKIKKTLRIIFERSMRQRKATNLIANEMAEKIFNNHH